MSRCKVLAVAVALVALGMAQQAGAQPPGGGQGGFGGGFGMMQGGGGSLMLLRLEQVRAELKLTEEQIADLKKLGETQMASMREIFSGVRDLPEEKRAEAMEANRKKMQEKMKETETKVKEFLLDSQKKRLFQINLQVQGIAAMADLEVAKLFKVTPEQQQKMETIRTEAAEKARTAFREMRDATPEKRREMFSQMGAARKDVEAKVKAVLTPQQLEDLEKAKGEKFEIDWSKVMPQRGRGGAGGGEKPAAPTGERN